MHRKEINDKLTQAIVEVLGHIIHDDYAQLIDPNQIKKIFPGFSKPTNGKRSISLTIL